MVRRFLESPTTGSAIDPEAVECVLVEAYWRDPGALTKPEQDRRWRVSIRTRSGLTLLWGEGATGRDEAEQWRDGVMSLL